MELFKASKVTHQRQFLFQKRIARKEEEFTHNGALPAPYV
jgi:hypothetical protein